MSETDPVSGTLVDRLNRSCRLHADRVAIRDAQSGASITYAELSNAADALGTHLLALGVAPGDRVGLHLRKSIDAIVAIVATLRVGAAYVPVDPDAPSARAAYILNDCTVRVVIVDDTLAARLRDELSLLGAGPHLLELPEDNAPIRIAAAIPVAAHAVQSQPAAPAFDDLAYILYTSGSTGRPKGVRLSHRAAASFVGWCEQTFEPQADDVYSSHAPLHFDLSIHDVYVPLSNGATLVLFGEQLGKDPMRLAEAIATERISVWYSTPSVLNLLTLYGRLDRHDLSALRLVLFAGEVFPVAQLRRLKEQVPNPRYFNLYGPTETNVCTYYEIPPVVPQDRTEAYPIGAICPPLRGRVVDASDAVVSQGTAGELLVAGPGIMDGYWNLEEQNERAFLIDEHGERWYRTGDLVVEDGAMGYVFHGRRDRMVKRHGYRIELGDIENGLAGHPSVREVAVIAIAGADEGVRIRAFLGVGGEARPSIIALKQFSVERLPRYMVPDSFEFLDALPRTSTDKIDYQTLRARSTPT